MGRLQKMPHHCGVSHGAAVCGSAQAVESQIVGYNTINVEAGKWYAVGVQFKGTGSATDAICINDLISVKGLTPETFPACVSSGTCPEIQVWNGTGYVHYYYISNAIGQSAPCWANGPAKLVTTENLGKGFWFIAPVADDNATVTFAGEVKSDTQATISVGTTEWVQACNSFPVALTQDMITTTGLTPETFPACVSSGTCPEIQVWNGTGYVHYYYISNAIGQSAPCWANGPTKATSIAEIGKSLWIKSLEAGTLTIDINVGK